MGRNLPPRVFAKGRWYYHVRADGTKRVWQQLSLLADGLPALYRALAQLERERVADDRMPSLIADWQRDVMPAHADKTQRDEIARCRVIGEAFAEFKASQVTAPDVAEFLQPLRDRPRTHNLYRAQLRELMRYAIERGYRADNPVAHLRTMTERPRTRYLTDSELRRVRAAGMRGADGRITRAGRTLAALIEVMYLTGQRPSDVLDLRWQRDATEPDASHVTNAGLVFRPSKTRGSTGAAVLIEWTPRLRDAIQRLRALRAERLVAKRMERRVVSEHVFNTVGGQPLSYWGASSLWRRAVARAGIADAELRDIRAKALTDKEGREGMPAARAMGTHSTEAQTADYVRHRSARKTKATR